MTQAILYGLTGEQSRNGIVSTLLLYIEFGLSGSCFRAKH